MKRGTGLSFWIIFVFVMGFCGIQTYGIVLDHQKISDTQGGLAGALGNEVRFGCSVSSIGDFDGQCDVDLADFAVAAQSWLQDNPAIDIAPYLEPDGIIDFKELLVITEHWLISVE